MTRKERSDKTTVFTRRKVRNFFFRQDVSRALPSKRYTTKHGACHVLQMTLVAAYVMFKKDFPSVKLSYTSFTMLKPRNVKLLTDTFRETCACMYCYNV